MATKSMYKHEFSGQNVFINGFPKGGKIEKFNFFKFFKLKRYKLNKFLKSNLFFQIPVSLKKIFYAFVFFFDTVSKGGGG